MNSFCAAWADLNTRNAILGGNPKAVNRIFAGEYREYMQRDQAAKQITQSALQAQEQKKVPMQTAQQPVSQLSESEIRALPKDKREAAWDAQMDQELAALSNHKRR